MRIGARGYLCKRASPDEFLRAVGEVARDRRYLDPALAWTGVKHSGRGVSLSKIGYEHLTRAKSFHLRHSL